jgi:hypothetical protein
MPEGFCGVRALTVKSQVPEFAIALSRRGDESSHLRESGWLTGRLLGSKLVCSINNRFPKPRCRCSGTHVTSSDNRNPERGHIRD